MAAAEVNIPVNDSTIALEWPDHARPWYKRGLDERQATRIITSIIYIAFALACFIVGVEFYNAPAEGWLAPARWLVLDSAIVFIMGVVTVVYIILGRYRVQYFLIFSLIAVDAIMVVMGAVALWINNPHSQPAAVHDIMTAALVIKICSTAFTAMCYRYMLD